MPQKTIHFQHRSELRYHLQALAEKHHSKKLIDLSHFDISSITSFNGLFQGLGLHDLPFDLSSWDVSHVEDMEEMFTGLNSISCDLSQWDVSRVTNMRLMFSGCDIGFQDLSSWKTHACQSFQAMFCGSRGSLLGVEHLDVSSARSVAYMFYDIPHQWLEHLNVLRWNLSHNANQTEFLKPSGFEGPCDTIDFFPYQQSLQLAHLNAQFNIHTTSTTQRKTL